MTMAICLLTFRYSLAFHESEGRSCLCLGLFCLIQFCFSVISVFMYWCLFLAKVFSRTSSVCICCFIPSVLRFCHLLKKFFASFPVFFSRFCLVFFSSPM